MQVPISSQQLVRGESAGHHDSKDRPFPPAQTVAGGRQRGASDGQNQNGNDKGSQKEQQEVSQLHPPRIRRASRLEKPKGRKFNPFRLRAHDHVQDHGHRGEHKSKKQAGVDKCHEYRKPQINETMSSGSYTVRRIVARGVSRSCLPQMNSTLEQSSPSPARPLLLQLDEGSKRLDHVDSPLLQRKMDARMPPQAWLKLAVEALGRADRSTEYRRSSVPASAAWHRLENEM
jgi:hypothetical protein